jgi:hypothetical protein
MTTCHWCTQYSSATMCMGWCDLLQACGEQDDIINTNRGSVLRPLFPFVITMRPRSSNWQIARSLPHYSLEQGCFTHAKTRWFPHPNCMPTRPNNKNRSIEETTRVSTNLGPSTRSLDKYKVLYPCHTNPFIRSPASSGSAGSLCNWGCPSRADGTSSQRAPAGWLATIHPLCTCWALWKFVPSALDGRPQLQRDPTPPELVED